MFVTVKINTGWSTLLDEILIKSILAVELLIFVFVREYYLKKNLKDDSPIGNFSNPLKILIVLSVIFVVFIPLWYVFSPMLDSFTIKTGDMIRILGAVLFFICILLMWWTLKTLQINFDQKAENRFVVKTGPYAVVRHPMYTIFIFLTIAQTLLTSNLIIALGVPIMILFIVLRVNFEDQLLVKEFKEEYVEYKNSKKALIPKIW